ncbi:hypothetical protein PSPO01_14385 [Paraphaeosphaeria sporulosa]
MCITLFLASKKRQLDAVRKILETDGYFKGTCWTGSRRTELPRRACKEV